MLKLNSKRESGIELLKILALFIIILCHTYSTFANAKDTSGLVFFDYIQFKPIEYFIYQIFITFGYIGDFIFFACSAWFLVDRKENRIEKVISIIINCFVISMLFLIVHLIIGYDISKELIIKCFFPIINKNNWYITTYILFYLIYPLINKALGRITKKQHFVLALILFVFYFVITYTFVPSAFYKTDLIMFIVIFIIISYIKKYMSSFCANTKINLIMLIITGLAFYSLIFINFALHPINIKWHVLNNPFFLIIAISLINLFSKLRIHSNLINTISALSLFIYIMHDNILFREFLRPEIASYVINGSNHSYIMFELIVFAVLLFIFSTIVSYLYYALFNEKIDKLSNNIKEILYSIMNKTSKTL